MRRPGRPDDVQIQDVRVPDLGRLLANRITAEIFAVAGDERWRSQSSHGGDRTSVTTPAGGVPTMKVIDAHGQTTELWQYASALLAIGASTPPPGTEADCLPARARPC
jgi:hypothetical protein